MDRDMRKVERYLLHLSHHFKDCENLKNKHKPNTCTTCGVTFSSRTKLFNHLRLKKHAQLGVSPRGYCYKYDHIEDEEYAVGFVRWLLTPMMVSRKSVEHRLSSAVNKGQSSKKNVFEELEESNAFSFKTPVPRHVLDAKLDCGLSVYSLIAARCLLTKHDTPSRSYLINLCKEAHERDDILDDASTEIITDNIWYHGDNVTSTSEYADLIFSPLGLAQNFKDAEMIEKLLNVPTDQPHILKEMCLVCYGPLMMCCNKKGSVIQLQECGHNMCTGVMEGWISAQVEALRGIDEIKAPCCNSTILTPLQVHTYAAAGVAERAERHSLEKALVMMGDWIWCPSCPSGGFKTGCKQDKACRSVICVDCNFNFCVKCGVSESIHTRTLSPQVLKCADADEHVEVKENDVIDVYGKVWLSCAVAAENSKNKTWLDKNSKKCPEEYGGCGVITQRDGGCSHMTCHLCKFQWCWCCGGKYKGGYTMGNECGC